MFHGRASGLDAATVVADGIIRFQKGHDVLPVRNQSGFWLLLVDTCERTPTLQMVERVADLRKREPDRVERSFHALSSLVSECEIALAQGDLAQLGKRLNAAHAWLQNIGVSTPALDDCAQDLRAGGALGAKLTGGGGGGLVLALFQEEPQHPVAQRWAKAPHFLTFVPAGKSP